MSDENVVSGDQQKLALYEKNIMSLYGIYIASAILSFFVSFAGWMAIAVVVMAYIKRKAMRGTLYYDHACYMIKTFWVTFIVNALILSVVTYAQYKTAAATYSALFITGSVISILLGLWVLIRCIAGPIKIKKKLPLNRKTWFI